MKQMKPAYGIKERVALSVIIVQILGITSVIALKIWVVETRVVPKQPNIMENFKLKTSAFKEGELIPPKYTCDGEDVNPLLEIRNVPTSAKSLALIMDDPDASRGTPWDHWIVWNINPKTQYISEDNLPSDARQGINSGGKVKYSGPCPPSGKPAHRYIFTLYALDSMLELESGAPKEELLRVMEQHILEHTSIMGMYGRK